MDYQEIIDRIKSKQYSFSSALKEFSIKFETIKSGEPQLRQSIGRVKETYGGLLTEVGSATLKIVGHFNYDEDRNTFKDFEETLLNFLALATTYHSTFGKEIKDAGYSEGIGVSPYSYKGIQKFFNTFSSSSLIEKTKAEFAAINVDTSGYEEKFDDGTEARSKRSFEKRRLGSIILGLLCAAVVIIILLVKNPPYSGELSIVLKIVMALGAAGISAGLLGYIRWHIMGKGIDMAGGFVVGAIVLFSDIKPWSTVDKQSDFSATIVLKDANDDDIADSSIRSVDIRLGENRKQGELVPSSAAFLFRPVPFAFRDSMVEVQISSNKWMFKNYKRSLIHKLTEGRNIINIIRDTLSLQVWGTISYEGAAKKKKPKVEVYVKEFPSIRMVVDELGTYRLAIPPEHDRGSVRLVFLKNGLVYIDKLFNYGSNPVSIK